MALDLLQTLALAAIVFVAGIQVKRLIPALERLSVPAAVIGGVLFALVNLALRETGRTITLDTSAQSLFMVTFFTSIGIGASLDVLRRGGVAMVSLLVISTIFGLAQNILGVGIASVLGVHPLLGVVAGSLTLMGGPATGMAFSGLFEQAGVESAGVVAITAATVGILFGGLTGGPVGAFILRRRNLVSGPKEALIPERGQTSKTLSIDMNQEGGNFTYSLLILGAIIGVGSVISGRLTAIGWTLPGYVGAMVLGSAIRNVLDARSSTILDVSLVQFVGGVSLNIFLTVALMNLHLWELVNVAVPLAVILSVQVGFILVVVTIAGYTMFGRDYDSAVVAGGFVGYMLGTTANAVANMQTLSDKYGFAPRAFLIVPVVGGLFIDFTNAVMINVFVGLFGSR